MTNRKTSHFLLFAVLSAAITASGTMKTKPVWDLATDAGERSAQFVRDGFLPVDFAHAFDVPNAAVRDTAAFTVEVSFTCDDATPPKILRLLRQKTPTTGWGLNLHLNPRGGSPIELLANDASFNAGWWRPKAGGTNTFVITSRRGMVVVYENGRVLKRFYTQLVPNLEPIRVGPTAPDGGRGSEMPGVRLRSLRFWDGTEEYWAQGEAKDFAEGFCGGPGWLVSCPTEDPAKPLPRILCYGDSILLGYGRHLRERLDGKAYVYTWQRFEGDAVGDKLNGKPYAAAAGLKPFDAIVFNNGLHSLKWTEDKVGDADVMETQRAICRALRAGAPGAKMFWLSTTPQTAKAKNAQGVVDATGERNGVVLRINRLTAKVAEEERVPTIDGYGLLAAHLDWAIGDGYHWKPEGSKALAALIADTVMSAMRRPEK